MSTALELLLTNLALQARIARSCWECGDNCSYCIDRTQRVCRRCRGGYCTVHNEGSTSERCDCTLRLVLLKFVWIIYIVADLLVRRVLIASWVSGCLHLGSHSSRWFIVDSCVDVTGRIPTVCSQTCIWADLLSERKLILLFSPPVLPGVAPLQSIWPTSWLKLA